MSEPTLRLRDQRTLIRRRVWSASAATLAGTLAGLIATSGWSEWAAALIMLFGAAILAARSGHWHWVIVSTAAASSAVSATIAWAVYIPAVLLIVGLVMTGPRAIDGRGMQRRGSHLAIGLGVGLLIHTLATAIGRASASLPLVALIVGLLALATMAWRYFSRIAPDSAAGAVLWPGCLIAAVFLAFAVPRLTSTASGSWTRIYEDSPWVNPNTLGLFFILCLSIGVVRIADGAQRMLYICTAVLLTAATAVTFSRSAYLALLAILVLLAAHRLRRVVVLLSFTGLIVWQLPQAVADRVSYTTNSGSLDQSSATRLELWGRAWQITQDNIATGVGLHSVGSELGHQGGEYVYVFAHNSFLTLAAATGLLFSVIVLGGVILLLRTLWRQAKVDRPGGGALPALLALVGTLVCSLFGEPLLSPITIIPLIAILSPALSTSRLPSSPSDAGGKYERAGDVSGADAAPSRLGRRAVE